MAVICRKAGNKVAVICGQAGSKLAIHRKVALYVGRQTRNRSGSYM